MKRVTAAASVLLLGVGLTTASAQEIAQDSTPGLEAEYTMQVGDYAAILPPEFLRIGSSLSYPVVVTYEPEPNRLGRGDLRWPGHGRAGTGSRR